MRLRSSAIETPLCIVESDLVPIGNLSRRLSHVRHRRVSRALPCHRADNGSQTIARAVARVYDPAQELVSSGGMRSMDSGQVVRPAPAPLLPAASAPLWSVRLVDGFALSCDGRPIRMPISAQRLVAFLSLVDRPVPRPRVAGTLWPDTTDGRAMGNLRSVLWRLRRTGDGVISDADGLLALAARVAVDAHDLVALARSVVDGRGPGPDSLEALAQSGGLLPDWSDDWVLAERERFRQLRLHALETACGRLVRAGEFGQAVEVCLAAVAEEPLRESAQRQLINLYLAEGNRIDALRQYESFRLLIGEELGIEPSQETKELVGSLGTGKIPARAALGVS
jgi:DNA-binding SARP family transcriptional activator